MSELGPGRGGEPERRSTPVSVLTVPLLFLGLLVGFFAGYLLLWWGALVVALLVVAGLSLAISGRSRDAAAGLVLGGVGGYLVVMALALFVRAL